MVVVVEAVEVIEVVLVVPGVVVDVDVAVAHEAKIIDDTIRIVGATQIIPRFIGPPVFFWETSACLIGISLTNGFKQHFTIGLACPAIDLFTSGSKH
jgi:hypothetical protein